MSISKDLFLAILAMDSYNRGYEAGIADGEGTKDATGKDIDGLGEVGIFGFHIFHRTIRLVADYPCSVLRKEIHV